MKTIAEIAHDVAIASFTVTGGDVEERSLTYIESAIADGIHAYVAAQGGPVGQVEFNDGDRVRLTGRSWAEFGVTGDVVTITGHDEFDGWPVVDHPDYRSGFAIWADENEDYSAELVEGTEES
jgi:hypothetical protein